MVTTNMLHRNALYTWELGMHAISRLMGRLLATQRLDLAIPVAYLVFDPTVILDSAVDTRCWKFLPSVEAAARGVNFTVV